MVRYYVAVDDISGNGLYTESVDQDQLWDFVARAIDYLGVVFWVRRIQVWECGSDRLVYQWVKDGPSMGSTEAEPADNAVSAPHPGSQCPH